MNSRGHIKSIDRDISQRKKKSYYPQNVQKVASFANNIVCHYHNEIENIFGSYPIDKFVDELSPEKVQALMKDLNKDYHFSDDDLSSIYNLLIEFHSTDNTNDPHYILSRYVNVVLATDKLLAGINVKLSQTITHGLIRYCVSFADYCTSDIGFIVNYEKIIQKNEKEIMKEVKDIKTQYQDFKKKTDLVQSVLFHSSEVIESISRIRASINKLYYLVTEWVDEERNYSSNLAEEMKLVKSQVLTIQQRSDSLKESITHRQERLMNLDKHIQILRKNQNILRRKHRRIRHSRLHIDGMIKQIDNQSIMHEIEVEKLENNSHNSEMKTTSKKKENKVNSTIDVQKDVRVKQDNKVALCRHRERLTKIDMDMCEKIDIADRELSLHEATRDRLLKSLKEDNEAQVKDLEKLKELYPIMEDLNFVYSRKNSQESLRQLRNHGRLIVQTKEVNFVDKMCEVVAKSAPDNWRELYLNLPFFPSRSEEKRVGDIEVIDLVSARNHSDSSKQATMSLSKWRLFYHNATPQHLIEGLKKSNLHSIAKEIEELDAKSKHRYEED